MNKEVYELQDGKLRIIDESIGLSLEDAFSPTRIDLKAPSATQLKEGETIIVKRNSDEIISQAFVELGGMRHGHFCLFYPSGKLQGESFYKHGKLHGPSSFYAEDGQRLTLSFFFDGEYQGKVRHFHLDGGLCRLECYKGGKLHGAQKYFFESGAVKSLVHYENAKLSGSLQLFYENGQLKRETCFKQGEKHGFDRIWTEDGTLIDEGEYDNGKPVGTHKRWYDKGSLMEEILYHTSKRFDKKRWDQEQNIVYEGIYDDQLNFTQRIRTEAGKYQVQTGKWDSKRLVLDRETSFDTAN